MHQESPAKRLLTPGSDSDPFSGAAPLLVLPAGATEAHYRQQNTVTGQPTGDKGQGPDPKGKRLIDILISDLVGIAAWKDSARYTACVREAFCVALNTITT